MPQSTAGSFLQFTICIHTFKKWLSLPMDLFTIYNLITYFLEMTQSTDGSFYNVQFTYTFLKNDSVYR